MSSESDEANQSENTREPSTPTRIVNAEELFGDRREICIELEGVRYRLRITRRNKLILQK